MKPPQFELVQPTSLAGALESLAAADGDGKILAGGQSLIPLLNFRLARPRVLIDLNGIKELDYIRREGSVLCVGAMTRHRTVERSPLVAECLPLLRETMSWVGHWQIRTRGTIGGSVAHADPAAELPALLLTLDGEVVASSTRGNRRIPARDLFVTLLTNALEPDEILTEVRFPILPAGTGWAFEEVARRHGDFALAAATAVVRLDAGGAFQEVRIGMAGVGDNPVRATVAETYLIGRRPDGDAIAHAAHLAAEGLDPMEDIHASAAYRATVGGTMVERALNKAVLRAQGGDR